MSPSMAPTIAMVTPVCNLCLGGLEFIADQNGEFGLRTTVAPLQAVRFGSLDFIANGTRSLHRLTNEEVTVLDANAPL
jgi:hypothetical protein